MVDLFHTGLAKEPGGVADTYDGIVRDPCTMVLPRSASVP